MSRTPKPKHPSKEGIAKAPPSQDTEKYTSTPEASVQTGTATTALAGTSTEISPPTGKAPDRRRYSKLKPTEPRKNAVVGQRDESRLRVACKHVKTGKSLQLDFVKRTVSEIDWNNKAHVAEINQWRNQIYNRAGMKMKEVDTWSPDEELWIELYCHLSIAEATKQAIRQPQTKAIGEVFLAFFVDREVKDRRGVVVEREPRSLSSFSNKFIRVYPDLKRHLKQSMLGTTGDAFMPTITDELLNDFKKVKAEMVSSGGQTQAASFLQTLEWRAFFLPQPAEEGNGDITLDNKEGDQDESDFASELAHREDDAAGTLVSMAAQPNSIRTTPVKIKHKPKAQKQSVASPTPNTSVPTDRSSEVKHGSDLSRPSSPQPSSDGPRKPKTKPPVSRENNEPSKKSKLRAFNAHLFYEDSDRPSQLSLLKHTTSS